MDVTVGNIALVNTAVVASHERFSAGVKTWWQEIADEVKSTNAKQAYASGERTIKMREWKGGPRQLVGGNRILYEVTNRKFEATLMIDREDLEDDLLGTYDEQIQSFARAQKKWVDYLVRDALLAAKTTVCDDGRPFFANNHYESATRKTGSQSNLYTSKPLNRTNLDYGIKAMKSLKDATGEKFGEFGEDMVLYCGSDLESIALELCNSALIIRSEAQSASGSGFGAVQNIRAGQVRPVILNDMNEDGVWLLGDVSGGKPIKYQNRIAPDFVAKTNPVTDEDVFKLDKLIYGTRARGEIALRAWWRLGRFEPS